MWCDIQASQECKLCAIMCDFNINLLNYESDNNTDDFLNTLRSFFFQSHILRPTRMITHSATLIDNIFYKSIDQLIIRGNIVSDIYEHLPKFFLF